MTNVANKAMSARYGSNETLVSTSLACVPESGTQAILLIQI